MKRDFKIAYVSRVIYPSLHAHALQTIQMAAAFARVTGDTKLIVRDILTSEAHLREQYGIEREPLRIESLRLSHLPAPLRRRFRRTHYYGSWIAVLLGLHREWRRDPGRRRVLFLRSWRDGVYWGAMRPFIPWLKSWTFVCELHDLRLAPLPVHALGYDPDSTETRKASAAFRNYDLLLTVANGLAEDLRAVTRGAADPWVVPNSTGLPRLDLPPTVDLTGERAVLGYMGTLDRSHGVEDLLRALEGLPPGVRLKLVGRLEEQDGGYIRRLLNAPGIAGRVEWKPHVAYPAVAAEIDSCDIMLAPAGDARLSRKYRCPLKIIDYMARGKPIIAADEPSHRELLGHGRNALLYRTGDPADLARQVGDLMNDPRRARGLAQGAWEKAAAHTYDLRARRILDLLDGKEERGRAGRAEDHPGNP